MTRRPAGSQVPKMTLRQTKQFLDKHNMAGTSVLPLQQLTTINERVSIVSKLNTAKSSLFKLYADLLRTISLMINASSISY